ncbi:MAG: ATPase domain-containing protein, partial [Gemmatimonadales bacterium]
VREGYHDFRIEPGGLVVYPRLVAAEHRTAFARELVRSGLPALDTLLGGGLSRGTSTLFLGPAGSGKSSLATQYVRAGVARGEHAVMFLFDESIATFVERSSGLGFDVAPLIDSERLMVRQIDPAELSPGAFAQMVRTTVAQRQTRMVVIDSLNGYLQAMPSEKLLLLHLHELLSYLGLQGVTTIMLMAQHGLVASFEAPVDTSYLADTVVLLRFFEVTGRVQMAISVMKKRTGSHERTIREVRLEDGTLAIGEPIEGFLGVLTGTPRIVTPREAAERA